MQEKIDNLREVLAVAFEASLLAGQSQETAIAKKLASWAAILAVPTAIAGPGLAYKASGMADGIGAFRWAMS